MIVPLRILSGWGVGNEEDVSSVYGWINAEGAGSVGMPAVWP